MLPPTATLVVDARSTAAEVEERGTNVEEVTGEVAVDTPDSAAACAPETEGVAGDVGAATSDNDEDDDAADTPVEAWDWAVTDTWSAVLDTGLSDSRDVAPPGCSLRILHEVSFVSHRSSREETHRCTRRRESDDVDSERNKRLSSTGICMLITYLISGKGGRYETVRERRDQESVWDYVRRHRLPFRFISRGRRRKEADDSKRS